VFTSPGREGAVEDRRRHDRAPYDRWIDEGHLVAVEGTRVDHRIIRDTLLALRHGGINIRAVGFDPWHSDQLQVQLVHDDGFEAGSILEVSQTFAGMSSGCKALEAAVLAATVDAGGCPLMEWCVSNAVVQRDNKDNIYPVKRRSRGRIDPVVALAIAWNLQLRVSIPATAEDPELVVA
jgi:phage terminase large subunit-like protein